MTKKHVAVLMGGWASERPVSIATGKPCAQALRNAGYKVSEIDMDRDIVEVLKSLKPDVVFNALHGPFGEDGGIQGVLELLQIPYTHSGVLASALAMDKEKAKTIVRRVGVPVAEAMVMDRMEAAQKHAMKPPYVIKPVNEGSSFGVVIVRDENDNALAQVSSKDWPYGERIMVERFIPGRELTCTVMGDVALGVTEIIPVDTKFYDFEAKYAAGGSKHECPAKIKPNIYQKIQTLSLKAHQAIGCRGVTRSDFRLDDGLMGTGELIWLELNTQPGMTPTSLVPELAAHAGHSFEDLVTWMVEDASCNR